MFDLAGLVPAGALRKPKPSAQLIGAQIWSLAFIEQEIECSHRIGDGAGPASGLPLTRGEGRLRANMTVISRHGWAYSSFNFSRHSASVSAVISS